MVDITPEMSRYVPKNLAKKMNVVPVRVSRDQLFLAMADPLNFMAIEEAKRTSKKRKESLQILIQTSIGMILTQKQKKSIIKP